jgi:hypothetical protein
VNRSRDPGTVAPDASPPRAVDRLGVRRCRARRQLHLRNLDLAETAAALSELGRSSSASSPTRIAHGERLDGHVEEGYANHALFAEHFQQCAEFLLLRNGGLGPLAVTVLGIPLARRAAATACAQGFSRPRIVEAPGTDRGRS